MKLLKNKIILAPMAGTTNEPFRFSLKLLNTPITFTEMISTEGLARKINKTVEMIEIRKEPPIIIPQLFGNNPISFLKSIELLIEKNFRYVDINMGCPAKKIIKKGAGVALMKQPELIKIIVKEIKKNFDSIKLTAKLRLGFDETSINYLEIIKILYNEGIDAITLHPRHGKQFFSGKADWNCIKKAKNFFPNLFIIGNGDVQSCEDIENMFNQTKCDAVMIGRKFLENPFIAIQWEEYKRKGNYKVYSIKDKIEYFKKLFYFFKEYYGEEKALKISIKHIIHLTKGEKGSAEFRKKISKIKKCIEFFSEISYWLEKWTSINTHFQKF